MVELQLQTIWRREAIYGYHKCSEHSKRRKHRVKEQRGLKNRWKEDGRERK